MATSIPKRIRRLMEWRQPRVVALTVISCVIVLAILVMVLKVFSGWLAETDGIIDPATRAEEVGRARTVVLALLAGGLAAVGAYYTHRNFGLNRQGQITERFTRAIDQLGSASRDVRLGGIYALERIARESQADHGPVIEILTAYVREHAPMVPEHIEQELIAQAPEIHPEAPAADVQAALTVLGRRNTGFDPGAPWHLDLAGTYLPRANLRNAHLRGADLSHAVLDLADASFAALDGARLVRTRLYGANLTGAQLVGAELLHADMRTGVLRSARLREAKMVEAQLDRARLRGAFLQGADLTGAGLAGTDLVEADLAGCHLIGAHLENALLSRTNLTGAELTGAELRDARYSGGTKWPEGFDVTASDATRVKGE